MSVWTEIHDPKDARIRNRPKGPYVKCEECNEWQGHISTCSQVTKEDLLHLLKNSRKNEEWARKNAANWLKQLQRLTGKLAILKHENNKLRRRNEEASGLKAKVADLREQLSTAMLRADGIRKRFCDIVPGLTSRTWEDIWERVRELCDESS